MVKEKLLQHGMKTYGGVDIQLHHSCLQHWMEVSSQLLSPVALTPGTQCVGG
jgi:hypothetical protein